LNKELNKALKKHELHASQWSVLFCVHEHKKMTLTDIWTYLNVEAPTITRTVNRLVELDWLKIEDGDDRREKNVSLTKKAMTVFPDVEKTVIDFENHFLNHIGKEEQAQLITLLRRIKEREEHA